MQAPNLNGYRCCATTALFGKHGMGSVNNIYSLLKTACYIIK